MNLRDLKLENILTSLKSHFSERVSNPFFPAFCLSWAVINFEVIVFLFSSMEAKAKVSEIHSALGMGPMNGWWLSLLLPALLAGAYIILSPWLTRFVMYYLQMREKDNRVLLIPILEESPMPVERIVEMKKTFTEKVRELEAELEREDNKAGPLNELLKAETAKNAEIFAELATARAELLERAAKLKKFEEQVKDIELRKDALMHERVAAEARLNEAKKALDEMAFEKEKFSEQLGNQDAIFIEIAEKVLLQHNAKPGSLIKDELQKSLLEEALSSAKRRGAQALIDVIRNQKSH